MGKAEHFNDKLGWWLHCQQEIFKDPGTQEEIYHLIELAEENSGITDEERLLMKNIFKGMLKLSFILNNNPLEADKLIQYLQ